MAFQKKSPAARKRVIVPSLEEAVPAYAQLQIKRQELEAQRGSVEKQVRDLKAGKIPADLIAASTERAMALLGDAAGDDGAPAKPVVSREDIRARLADLTRQQADLDGAIKIIDDKIARGRVDASKVVCDQIRDGYNEAIREVAFGLVAVIEAHRRYLRIIDQLEVFDVRWTGNLLQPNALRRELGGTHSKDVGYAVNQFIVDAIDAGIVTSQEIEEAADAA
jgi:hypothetical protein